MNANCGRSRGKCFGGNLSDAGIKRLIYVSGSERREINISQKILDSKTYSLLLDLDLSSWLATILSICICSSTFFEAGLLSNWIGFSKKLHLGERRGLICCAPSVPDLCFFIIVVSFIITFFHHVSHLIIDRIAIEDIEDKENDEDGTGNKCIVEIN